MNLPVWAIFCVFAAALTMAAGWYFLLFYLSWASLRRQVWDSMTSNTAYQRPDVRGFIAHRVEIGESTLKTRDNLFKVYPVDEGIYLGPRFNLSEQTLLLFTWDKLSVSDKSEVIESAVEDIAVRIWMSRKHWEIIREKIKSSKVVS